MFGKLLKYDFRSMLHQFALLWPAALALALVNGFMLRSPERLEGGSVPAALLLVAFIAVLMTIFIAAVIFIIQRFYKGLLGDEGYLMHTLPVTPWGLAGSKLLCAVATTAISILVAIASFFLLMWAAGASFQGFFAELRATDIPWAPILAQSTLFTLVGMAMGFLLLYLAMAIGHLFSKHKVLFSVAAYIVINTLMNSLVEFITDRLGLRLNLHFSAAVVEGSVVAAGPDTRYWNELSRFMWQYTAVFVILGALYYAATCWILQHKLNLE